MIFFTYFIYSIFAGVTHIVFSALDSHQETIEKVVTVFEEIVNFYIIVDKGTHFIHSNTSVSLFLSDERRIPKRKSHSIDLKEELLQPNEQE